MFMQVYKKVILKHFKSYYIMNLMNKIKQKEILFKMKL